MNLFNYIIESKTFNLFETIDTNINIKMINESTKSSIIRQLIEQMAKRNNETKHDYWAKTPVFKDLFNRFNIKWSEVEDSDFEIVENGQELKVGDTVHIKMKVTDDSGINYDRTYAVVSNGDHYIWFTWNYNESTGYLEGSYTFKETDILGTYSVGYVPCYDIYDNYLHGSASGYVKFVS
jgi:hypothetical protein